MEKGGQRAFGPGRYMPLPNGPTDDGLMLVADSRQPGASRWGCLPFPSHRSGKWMSPPLAACGTNTQAFTINVPHALPMQIPMSAYYTGIGVLRVATVNLMVERLGIFADGGGVPGALLYDLGTTAAATGTGQGGFKFITPPSSFYLKAGVVFVAACPQGGVGTYYSVLTANTGAPIPIATTLPAVGNQPTNYNGTAMSGAYPQTWDAASESTTAPVVWLRRQ